MRAGREGREALPRGGCVDLKECSACLQLRMHGSAFVGFRMGDWAGCGAQGGYRGCVGWRVRCTYIVCCVILGVYEGMVRTCAEGVGGRGAAEHMGYEDHCSRRIGL